jgi:SAM-dependent methyltransferase
MRFFAQCARMMRRAGASQSCGEQTVAHDCGLHDLCMSGWFHNDTGELFTGFPLGPSDIYLDVGCGDGGATMFAARQGCEVVATDVLPDKISALERKLAAAGAQRYRCVVSDSNPLPLPDASVTRIVCSEVLEHVPDPNRFLSELMRVGAPGALYLLTVPAPASEAIQRELAPDTYWRIPNHVRVFEHEEFASAITQAGLSVEARHFIGFYNSVWWSLFWSARPSRHEQEPPLLEVWARAWREVLRHPDGMRVKRALDRVLPKSQVIVARKAA